MNYGKKSAAQKRNSLISRSSMMGKRARVSFIRLLFVSLIALCIGVTCLGIGSFKGVIDNVAAVVTRYFGGVLLGTGGLVRAYSKSLQEGLAVSTIIEKTHGISMEIITDYTGIGKIQYIAGEQRLPILDTEYTDKVVVHLLVPSDQIQITEKKITQATNGRARLKKDRDLYYAAVNGEIKIFQE